MSDDELLSIYGGVSKTVIGGIVLGIITFLVGVIDGFKRPLACNK